MDALRIRQMQLAMASARHELLYTRGRFINETLGPDRRAEEEWLPIPPCTSLHLLTSPRISSHLPASPDRRAVEEWLTKGRAVLNVVDELRRLPACHQS